MLHAIAFAGKSGLPYSSKSPLAGLCRVHHALDAPRAAGTVSSRQVGGGHEFCAPAGRSRHQRITARQIQLAKNVVNQQHRRGGSRQSDPPGPAQREYVVLASRIPPPSPVEQDAQSSRCGPTTVCPSAPPLGAVDQSRSKSARRWGKIPGRLLAPHLPVADRGVGSARAAPARARIARNIWATADSKNGASCRQFAPGIGEFQQPVARAQRIRAQVLAIERLHLRENRENAAAPRPSR